MTSQDSTNATVDVFLPEGGTWADVEAGDVTAVPFGSGTLVFPTFVNHVMDAVAAGN